MTEQTSTASASAGASIATEETLAIRVSKTNPDHHLWNNHGTWWLHCTVHQPDHTSQRIRRSLKTGDVEKARLLRDRLFTNLGKEVAS